MEFLKDDIVIMKSVAEILTDNLTASQRFIESILSMQDRQFVVVTSDHLSMVPIRDIESSESFTVSGSLLKHKG